MTLQSLEYGTKAALNRNREKKREQRDFIMMEI
jgi:hypothetical protein